MNLGAPGASGDIARLRRELDRLQALGITNVRVIAASEGPPTAPYRTLPSLMPSPGLYNEEVFEGLDTVNGRAYREDPTIFSWRLAKEPRNYPANWINDTAQYIKALDPNHLVSVGSEGSWGGDFTATHQSQYVDYTTCHIWVEPWGKYNPDDSSAASLQTATDFATGYLRDHDAAAKKLGKPLVLEEFGLARDGWTAGGKYDPAATTGNRDKYYGSLYAVVESSLSASGGALAGDNFWAWSGEARPPSKWTGDPPHETPGWCSVYDTDQSTSALILAHARAVQKR